MFHLFRRHQKRILVVVTILAMGAFVFPIGSSYFTGSDSAPKNKSEMKVRFELTDESLASLRAERVPEALLLKLNGLAENEAIRSRPSESTPPVYLDATLSIPQGEPLRKAA